MKLDIIITVLGKTLLFLLIGLIVAIISIMLFTYSTEWLWPEYNGSYNLGNGIYMIEWEGGGKLIVKGSSIRGNTCYGGEYIIPTYENGYDSNGNFAEYVVHAKANDSWITRGGEPVQYIQYMPYGEIWCNQRRTVYNERFQYTGKELDMETGYNFFGARNYMSDVPTWLSPDPLSDKYPGISPYAYGGWNPMKHVDPDGRDWYEAEDGTISWTRYHCQQELSKNGIIGTYLGEAVLDFKGSFYETLGGKDSNMSGYDSNFGTWGYIDGLGAITADVTMYGPNGKNDIVRDMVGFTMSSDYSTFGAIDEGDYTASYVVPGKNGALKSNWLLSGKVNEYRHNEL